MMTRIKYELRPRLVAYLMSNGTAGWREIDIYRKFDTHPREEVLMELEALWAEELAQRFTLGPKHVIWRATDKMNM